MAKVADKAAGEIPERKLTPKQEKFAQAYVETSNASEAYRQSYNAQNMTPEVIWVKACELLKNGKVSVRVAEIQAEHAKAHDITVDFLTQEYREAIQLAKDTNSAAGLTGAITALGKLHGLITDKVKADVDQRTTHDIEPVSRFAELLGRSVGSRATRDPERVA